ncbi:MAG: radical SAM protein [Candidatus Omnitrophota bacterium]
MQYIYGPVNSRRLGLSLGISLTTYKVCNFDCIYCQLGKAHTLTGERKEYTKVNNIIEELKRYLKDSPQQAGRLQYITLSGLGEPTLNINIGEVINQLKPITNIPLAVITNASKLSDFDIRVSLLKADLIVPSLDAVVPEVFAKIDRPKQDIDLEGIINGLINLRKEFRGKIWLEVMLVRGVNDDMRYIKKLNQVIVEINPNKIHLNSPVRTTSEPDLEPVDKNKLSKIKELLGDKCEIL